MTTIQVRIDEKTKRDSQKVLDRLGIDMSSAIKVYFRRIIAVQGIPFQLLTENGFTIEEEREILQASKEARAGKNISKAMTPAQAKSYLKKLA